MNKQQLRELYKEKRSLLSSTDKMKYDDLLLIQFQQLSFTHIQTVFSYWPLDHMNEPDTHNVSEFLHFVIPDLQLAYPRTNFSSSQMDAIAVNDDTIYITNDYGITEPEDGKTIDPKAIDLILVPLLIFDKKGFRVGYGKGFYDKYLSQCREDVIKVGFSYFDAIDRIDDTNEYDIPLNLCITPDIIYEF